MNEASYKRIVNWAEARPLRKKSLCFLNRGLPIVIGGFYVFFLLISAVLYPVLCLGLLLRPAACFLTVTLVRRLLGRPRPYDVFDFQPLCGYHPGKNRSFPSRHTASAAIIALEIFRLSPFFGCWMILAALGMGVLRIICGNHFIKDVLAAYGAALIFYLI